MARSTLKSYVKLYLQSRYPDFVLGGIIEDLGKGYGYSASNATRRARELVNEGVAEVQYVKGNRGERLASYRFKMPEDYKGRREYAKETGKLTFRIEVLPTGERVAREVIT